MSTLAEQARRIGAEIRPKLEVIAQQQQSRLFGIAMRADVPAVEREKQIAAAKLNALEDAAIAGALAILEGMAAPGDQLPRDLALIRRLNPYTRGDSPSPQQPLEIAREASVRKDSLHTETSPSPQQPTQEAREIVREHYQRGTFADGARLEADITAALTAAADKARRELIDVLKPFAEAAENLDDKTEDRSEIWELPAAMSITAGDLRRAARALIPQNPGDAAPETEE